MLIGLVPAAANIDVDAAREVWKRMIAAGQSLVALGDAELHSGWRDCLARLAASETSHPLLAGYASRLLYDAKVIEFEGLANSRSLALSSGNTPEVGANWVEGLLSGSGTLLIHDDRLRAVLDEWVREGLRKSISCGCCRLLEAHFLPVSARGEGAFSVNG